jgi:hypothetical protein
MPRGGAGRCVSATTCTVGPPRAMRGARTGSASSSNIEEATEERRWVWKAPPEHTTWGVGAGRGGGRGRGGESGRRYGRGECTREHPSPSVHTHTLPTNLAGRPRMGTVPGAAPRVLTPCPGPRSRGRQRPCRPRAGRHCPPHRHPHPRTRPDPLGPSLRGAPLGPWSLQRPRTAPARRRCPRPRVRWRSSDAGAACRLWQPGPGRRPCRGPPGRRCPAGTGP